MNLEKKDMTYPKINCQLIIPSWKSDNEYGKKSKTL